MTTGFVGFTFSCMRISIETIRWGRANQERPASRQPRQGTNSLRRHADGPVETDNFAVEIAVVEDVEHETCELVRPAEARWKGTVRPRASCTSEGMALSIGVSMIPGAMVTTRIPCRASSRAIGSVIATIPPLDAAYPASANLAIERRHRCRVNDDTSLTIGAGILAGNGCRSQAQHVEGADQVDLHRTREALEAVRSVPAEDLFRRSDACAIDEAI